MGIVRLRLISTQIGLLYLLFVSPFTYAASFTLLGDRFSGISQSTAHAVSADGSVVIGTHRYANGSGWEAFRWTNEGGMVPLGQLAGSTYPVSQAIAVSPDGNFVVGNSRTWGDQQQAFLWTSSDGMRGLGAFPDGSGFSSAVWVSPDGSSVIGNSSAADETQSGAYRWTNDNGMVSLGIAGGALAVSTDGNVVVGMTHDQQAFYWAQDEGTVLLGNFGGYSRAELVSSDGGVVWGYGGNALAGYGGTETFRWTNETGLVGIGNLPVSLGVESVYRTIPSGVSGDGTIMVGNGSVFMDLEAYTVERTYDEEGMVTEVIYDEYGNIVEYVQGQRYSFFWTEELGYVNLQDWLVINGVTGLSNWRIEEIFDISSDGEWVVGYAVNSLDGEMQAFRANITAVPIPAAVWLFGSGLALLGWVRRRSAKTRFLRWQ